MGNLGRHKVWIFGSRQQGAVVALSLAIVLTLGAGEAAQAQTFQVIHNFSGLGDGSEPNYGITIDAAGNLYGTTFSGNAGTGTVFKLANKNGNWVLSPLYYFPYVWDEGKTGSIPYATVVQGRDGTLYGTAGLGGNLQACVEGCGAVYSLKPQPTRPPALLSQWAYTPLQIFNSTDGANPYGGALIFDQAGNLYGTTFNGGTGGCPNGCGVVFKLTPSGGGWTETVLYNFASGQRRATSLGRRDAGQGRQSLRHDGIRRRLWRRYGVPIDAIRLRMDGERFSTALPAEPTEPILMLALFLTRQAIFTAPQVPEGPARAVRFSS